MKVIGRYAGFVMSQLRFVASIALRTNQLKADTKRSGQHVHAGLLGPLDMGCGASTQQDAAFNSADATPCETQNTNRGSRSKG